MGKSNFKDLFREIKASFGRFFAIFAIVFIGVAFFAGVTASSSDMKNSADHYYDSYQLCDIQLLSTIGFYDEDIEEIRGVNGVEGVYAGHSMDAVTLVDHVQSALKVISLPDTDLNTTNKDYINQLRIKEGRLPENSSECVVKYDNAKGNLAEIGQTITLESGTDKSINDSLVNSTLTVVGIVYNPYYLTYEIGTTDVGNGQISFCVYVPESNFVEEYYTEVYATVEGAKELDTYSDEYFRTVNHVVDDIKSMSKKRFEDNIENIKAEFESEKITRREEADQNIRQNVIDQLTSQYQTYYPGLDVSDMIAPHIENAYNSAVAAFDFSQIDAAVDKAMEETLANSDNWEWYGLTRKEQYSFRDYESSADRMTAIATVFPLFFFFVSGLVCLTTMTRMIDEQRELIGTYKALGYGKFAIAFKYISYAFIASLSGGLLGCIAGLRLFPTVIYNTWNILYEMPGITYANHLVLSVVAIASMVLITVAATVYSCYSELAAMPSLLMRPKSPKKGKKILLERIPLIWKHFSFTMKVTMRNLFLYKKRFMMTVVGIAGCTALLMAGFGVKDSISGLVRNQYEEIFQYDYEMTFSDDTDAESKDAVYAMLNEETELEHYISDYSYSAEVQNADTEKEDTIKTASISVIQDKEAYKDFVAFRNRRSKKEVVIEDDGVLISEKLANDLNVGSGDYISLEDGNGTTAEARVSGIFEVYVNHYIYMSNTYYEEIFGTAPEKNRVMGQFNELNEQTESLIGEKYLAMDCISSVTFFTTNISRFQDMIQSLNIVTLVLILSAASLAFVVLYNLTNVNISERVREIATIKVLGFYDREVGSYVYRENAFITLIGAVVGILLGMLLHAFIMKTVEMDSVMFGNEIKWISYVYSFLLTVLFSVIVNLFMYRRLKNIPMVESLKSVE